MLQRIQTVYLIIVVMLCAFQCFLPIGQFVAPDTVYSWEFAWLLNPETGESVYSTWAMAVLQVVMGCIALVTIFLYKKRVLQMRLSIVNMVLMIGFYLLYGYYYWLICHHIEKLMYSVTVGMAFPLISLILTIMAFRGIFKDEALVRSLDRLR